ncbi:unnamed protein product [Spirodela intermedia]|uniref:Uncharacterized protein n=1 Tax=Spirodela intermedia TaxID=51605 RepID=A0A7I8L5P8_SPIIN|nr:unnamed protein product [Spirodela intermedia]
MSQGGSSLCGQFFLVFLEVEEFGLFLRKSRRTVLLQRGHFGSSSDSITYMRQCGQPASTIAAASGLDPGFPSSDSEDTHELGGDEDDVDERWGELLRFLFLPLFPPPPPSLLRPAELPPPTADELPRGLHRLGLWSIFGLFPFRLMSSSSSSPSHFLTKIFRRCIS